MQIRALDLTRRLDVRQFIEMPFALYRDSPQWVPPLRGDMAMTLDRRRHPFYQHSIAAFFLAEENGQAVGRIAALYNRRHNAHHGTRTAFFYYFECVESAQVSRALFDAASSWARAQGADTLLGPKGFLQADGVGLLVDGFEHRPALGIAYNKPYYHDLLLDAGFAKETDYLSGYLSGTHQLSPRFYEIAEKVRERRGFHIRSFRSKEELRAWVPRIGVVYNEAFVDNWQFCPVTDAELQVIANRLIAVSDPRLIKLVLKGEEVVGFVFAFPDISAAIQRTKGRVWPFGWIRLLYEFRHTKWVNFNGTGLLAQHRGVGANAVLYTELEKTVRDFGFEHADVVQIEENNAKSLGDMTEIGVQWYKRHRIYRRNL